MNRLLPYARLLRMPNVFTAMADIAMAGLAAGALPDRWLGFLCLLLASSCLYCSGMVWNDYFDIEEDRRDRGYRPLPSGAISTGQAAGIGWVLMLMGLALSAVADMGPDGFRYHSTLVALLLIVAIFLYNSFLKRTWAGPLGMAACRFLNVLLGLSVIGSAPAAWGWGLALVVGLYIFGVTWFARTEATMSNQTSLVIGASVIIGSLVIALGIPPLVQDSRPAHTPPIIFPYLLVGFAVYVSVALIRAIQRPTPALVQAAVKRCILGLILLDCILATAVAGYVGLVVLILYVPSHFLGRWVYST